MAPPKLAVIYVQHRPDRYPGAFESLLRYLDRLWYCQPFVLIVDNRLVETSFTRTSQRTAIVGGDNTDREFSGWQRGYQALVEEGIDFDTVLLTNEAFQASGPSFLCRYPTVDDLVRLADRRAVIGRIDSYGESAWLDGHCFDRWVCTSAMFLPSRALEQLGVVTTFGVHDFERCLPVAYPSRTSSTIEMRIRLQEGARAVVRRGFVIPQRGPVLLTLNVAPAFVPRELNLSADGRELGVHFRELSLDGRPPASWLGEGWLDGPPGIGWCGKKSTAFFPQASGGVLTMECELPQGVAAALRADEVEVFGSVTADPFLPDAAISENYRWRLVEWLTARWHSRVQLNDSTWPLFREKVRAILNETALSCRLQRLGYELVPYGSEQFY